MCCLLLLSSSLVAQKTYTEKSDPEARKILKKLGLNKSGFIEHDLKLGKNETFFMKHKNIVLIYLILIILLICILIDCLIKKRKDLKIQ